MPPYNRELGLSTMVRVLRKAGGTRVSDDAGEELAKVLEEISYKLSRHAIDLATHAGRNTVKAEDIQLATKHMIKRQIVDID